MANGEALGAAGLQLEPDIAGRPQFCPAVVGVIVAPGYRGRGIGSHLEVIKDSIPEVEVVYTLKEEFGWQLNAPLASNAAAAQLAA